MKELLELLKSKTLTLGSVESFTGGLFASSFIKNEGASAAFLGSLVTYSNECKIKLAHVSKKTLDTFGAVSKETAYEMAKNGKDVIGSDIAISFTGNAGPTAMEDKPVGLVYIGYAIRDEIIVEELSLSGSRNEISLKAVKHATKKLISLVSDF